jgi:excisionase family DNA binding protein
MSAYATPLRRLDEPRGNDRKTDRLSTAFDRRAAAIGGDVPVLEGVIADLADRVAEAIAARLIASDSAATPEWLDSRAAAEYLGVHRDTVRKLAAERAIPAEQDGRGCKLFFRRGDLDDWRRAGGRNTHLRSALAA